MMTLRARRGQVILRRVKPHDVSGSILLPPAAQELPQEAMVLTVGDDVADLQEGDRVLIEKWLGAAIRLGSEDLLILEDRFILGKFEEAPDLNAAYAEHPIFQAGRASAFAEIALHPDRFRLLPGPPE